MNETAAKPVRERPSCDVKIRMLQAAIVAACSSGPVEWGKVQRVVNIVAETFFGDPTRCGTTIPAYPLAMQLIGEGKLRMSIETEDGPATYEAIDVHS